MSAEEYILDDFRSPDRAGGVAEDYFGHRAVLEHMTELRGTVKSLDDRIKQLEARDRSVRREAAHVYAWTTQSPAEVEQVFRRLADWWISETRNVSSVSGLITHPAFLQIIGLGQAAVPLILKRLSVDGAFWFPALAAITRENPVSESSRGNIRAMTDDWLDWARRNAGH